VPEARSVRYDRWRKIQFESRFAEEAQVGFDSKWDREFESPFLQRGVRNELLIDAAPFAGSASLT
jgi:hypothetical protein